MPGPTLAGFNSFLTNVVGVSSEDLAANAATAAMALAVALGIVNQALQCVAIPQTDSSGVALNGGGVTVYNLATYNLAASNFLSYAQDPPDAPIIPGSGDPGLPFFQYLRKQWGLNAFVSGVVQSTSDEGTSTSLVVQEAAKNFTLANLTQLKDPYGRQYLSLVQSYGPSVWGMS
jgi:hypothetical protein